MSGIRPQSEEQPGSGEPIIDGRYRVLGPLGSGAMGVVHLAEDVLLKRAVALKVIAPELARKANAAKALLREARALARLRHDNVVQIYAFGSSQDLLYFAMEYVDGETLDAMITRHAENGETVPPALALEIVTKIASGLSAVHAQNLVHRDVKPSNVVIERETGRPVLVDFGIAREVAAVDPKSSIVAAGTPSYMAPEQARNDRALLGQAADVYSLACTAFELLTGRPVFDGDDAYAVVHAHLADTPPPISSRRPELATLDRAFARALAKDPRARHATCDELAGELARAVQSLSPPGSAGLLGAAEPLPSSRRSPVPPPSPAPNSPSSRVLVLGEEGRLRQAVVREATTVLESGGRSARVECVAVPAALVAAFEREPADVVILDEDCAAGEGVELVRELRTKGGGQAAQILVITRDMLGERGEWSAVGARRIAKPVNLRALAGALDEVGKALPHTKH